MVLKRKIRKLFRDPRLFFTDMLIKHRKKLDKIKLIKKYNGQNQFTVVSAVYGVEKYLDDYFKSLVNQRLDFKNHIHLILVDDGSLDNSAKIIKKWQKKYPNNITYLYKENGGQASARNLGLEYVKTPWVTFIDPDDFINRDYFYSINEHLERSNNKYAFIGCNLFFYFEDLDQYKNNHPLNYKFKEKSPQVYTCSDLKKNIHMSSSSAIFSMDVIRKENLRFNEKIRPSFEDASFISYYLFFAGNSYKAIFLSESIYFYRKRADNSSTLDMAWLDPKKYKDVFIYGYLPLLEFYNKKLGKVPLHIQRQVLYDLVWYFKYLLNESEKLNFLRDSELEDFYSYYKEAFFYIDGKTIFDFELAKIWFYHKVLLVLAFKSDYEFLQQFYIERYNPIRKELRVSFFADKNADVQILIDDQDIIPISGKVIPQFFAKKEIGAVYNYYIPIVGHRTDSKLRVLINGKRSRVNLLGKIYPNVISLDDITAHLGSVNESITEKSPWVLIDRDTQGDDNAEHFYRYIKNNHPNREIYYALRKESKDWGRLSKEGFNLIEFGTPEYELLLKVSSKIISSHAEKYIHNYLPQNAALQKSFIFLQHGVIKHDLSRWLNSKINLDLFVTSSYSEFSSIKDNNSPYIFTERETKLTGLPRHDSLWKGHIEHKQGKKTILVMPTWRSWVVGDLLEETNHRTRNPDFEKSDYFKYWYSFLHSIELKEILEHYDYSIIFAPHKNIEMYLDSFNLPSYIEIWNSDENESIQNLFIKSDFMITDYSSVDFEMAYINKSTIYYQFDKEAIFSGDHTYKLGYFDYEKDGFGPIVTNQDDLLSSIKKLCENNGSIEKIYKERIHRTFLSQDTDNCKRVYQEILSFDSFNAKDYINTEILESFLKKSIAQNNMDLAIDRAYLLLKVGDDEQKNFAYSYIGETFLALGKIKDLFSFIESNKVINSRILFKALFLIKSYQKALDLYDSISDKEALDHCYMAICSAYEGDREKFYYCLNKLKQGVSTNTEIIYLIENIYSKVLEDKWGDILALEADIYNYFSESLFKEFRLEVLLAEAYRKTNNSKMALKLLSNYEKHTKNDAICRFEIARVSFLQKNYSKVIDQLNKALSDNYSYYPIINLYEYMVSLYKTKDFIKYPIVKEILISRLEQVGNSEKKIIYRDVSSFLLDSGELKDLITIINSIKSYEYAEETLFKVYCASRRYQDAAEIYKSFSKKTIKSHCNMAICSAYAGEREMFFFCLNSLKKSSDDIEVIYLIENIYSKVLKDKWDDILVLEADIYNHLSENFIKEYRLEILLAEAYRKNNNNKMALKLLSAYEEHTQDDAMCRFEIARVSFLQKNYNKVIDQLNKALGKSYDYYPLINLYEYTVALYKERSFIEYRVAKDILLNKLENKANTEAIEIKIKFYYAIGDYNSVVLMKDRVQEHKDKLKNCYILIFESLFILNKYEEVLTIADQVYSCIESLDDQIIYWKIMGELSVVNKDWEMAELSANKLSTLTCLI